MEVPSEIFFKHLGYLIPCQKQQLQQFSIRLTKALNNTFLDIICGEEYISIIRYLGSCGSDFGSDNSLPSLLTMKLKLKTIRTTVVCIMVLSISIRLLLSSSTNEENASSILSGFSRTPIYHVWFLR